MAERESAMPTLQMSMTRKLDRTVRRLLRRAPLGTVAASRTRVSMTGIGNARVHRVDALSAANRESVSRKTLLAKANPHDRSLRAHQPQRAENLHHARGMRAALQGTFRRRLEGRAVQAGIWQDQPQQQDPRDRRSRWAGRQALYRDRVRRDPDLPRREDRKVSAQGRGQEIRRAAVADDSAHRGWADVRPMDPFQA